MCRYYNSTTFIDSVLMCRYYNSTTFIDSVLMCRYYNSTTFIDTVLISGKWKNLLLHLEQQMILVLGLEILDIVS